MKILALLPIVAYMVFIFINTETLFLKQNINFFWIQTIEAPIVAMITIFFTLYILFIWFAFKFTNFFSHHKNKKLEKEVGGLKSKLLDGQGGLVKDIDQNFKKTLDKFIAVSDKKMEVYRKENDKVVSSLESQIKGLKDKIDKIKRIEEK